MRPDRLILALACLVACGGWVCDSASDNRCPGAATCDVEVANVCCPLGSLFWCDNGCSDSDCGTRKAYACEDTARVLECSFNASIEAATCDSPASSPRGTEYALHVTGTFTGCGQDGVQLAVDPQADTDASTDCGSWDDGVFGGCVSVSPKTTTTHFSFSQRVAAGETTVTLLRMHGSAPPIASMTVACGGR